MRAVLVGAPNCGKSALFNRLTGAHAPVGNRPGVTTQGTEAPFCAETGLLGSTLTDLPGLYSLESVRTAEEQTAANALRGGSFDLIVCVADAAALPRQLPFCFELGALGLPMLFVLSRADALRRGGGSVREEKLARALGCPVLAVSALKNEGIETLCAAIRAGGKTMNLSFWGTARQRFARADALLALGYVPPENGISRRMDKILLHPLFGTIFFLLLLFFVLYFSAFGPTAVLSERLQTVFSVLREKAYAVLLALRCAAPVARIASGAFFGGVGAVAAFLPQTVFLFAAVTFFEQSGYLCRAAVLCESSLRRFGLGGRCAVPLLLGLGCSVAAYGAVDTLPAAQQRRAKRLIPLIPCSAKMPLAALFFSNIFRGHPAFFFIVCSIGFCGMLLFFLLFSEKEKASMQPFFFEVPPYHMPRPQEFFAKLWQRLRELLFRLLTIVFLTSVLLYLLLEITPQFTLARTPQESLLYAFGDFACIVFFPLGLRAAAQSAALLCGIFFKESVLAALSLFSADPAASFSLSAAGAFLCFSLNVPPCPAALAALWRVTKRRRDFFRFLFFRTLYAYALACGVRLLFECIA